MIRCQSKSGPHRHLRHNSICLAAALFGLAPLGAAVGAGQSASPLGPNIYLSERNRISPSPTVASDATGNHVAVWLVEEPFRPGSTIIVNRLKGRCYTSAGNALGTAPFNIDGEGENQLGTLTAARPDVAMNPSGRFVVTWAKTGVVKRRSYGKGCTQPTVIDAVSSESITRARDPGVAMDASGNFTIAWVEDIGERNRRFGSAGEVFDATPLQLVEPGDIDGVGVAMDTDGDTVFVYSRYLNSNDQGEIYSRALGRGRAGALASNVCHVNRRNTGDELGPKIAMNPAGNHVVVWRSNFEDDGAYYQNALLRGFPAIGQCATTDGGTDDTEVISFKESVREIDVAMDAQGDFAIVAAWENETDDIFNGAHIGFFSRAGRQVQDIEDAAISSDHVSDEKYAGDPKLALDADGDVLIVAAQYYYDNNYDSPKSFLRRFNGTEKVDLSLSVATDPVRASGELAYRVTIKNAHAKPTIDPAIGSATGINVAVSLPNGITYSSFSGAPLWQCGPSVGAPPVTVRCSYLNALNAKKSLSTLGINATATRSGTATFALTGNQYDHNQTNNTFTVQSTVSR
ncbi:MAG: hypothetical protein ACT4QA_03490 [Panacagrimonas sp.]